MSYPCMEITGFGSLKKRTIDLIIHRKKGVIDFHPFFKDFFENRDRDYGIRGSPRFEETDEQAAYHFSMVELAEAFFGKFTPLEFKSFLKKLLIKNDMSEDLISEINHFEDKNRIAFVLSNNYPGNWNCVNRVYFFPFNFPKSNLNKIINETIWKRSLPKKRYVFIHEYFRSRRIGDREIEQSDIARCIYGRRKHFENGFGRYFEMVREYCLDLDPRIIFYSLNPGKINNLDLFEMIRKYHEIDTSNLKLVKKDN